MRNLVFVLILLGIPESVLSQKEEKESRIVLGFNAGANFSRILYSDTFPDNFSKRNRVGPIAGINGQFDLSSNAGIAFGLNMVNKGYRVFNDTLQSEPDIVRKFWSMNIPLGLHFRQQFNAQNYITEKFGLIGNFNFKKGGDSAVFFNREQNPNFKITEFSEKTFYPMFYLGFAMGGVTENNDRYEFGVTYAQSLGKDADLTVSHGSNFAKNFPLNYRGGFLQIGFSYYFNLNNFKKTSGYFY